MAMWCGCRVGIMGIDLKRVVVGLTTAQRLQGMIYSLGVCESGRVGLGTHYASWLDGLTRCEGDGVVEMGRPRVQRVYCSLDRLRYSHSVGTPRQRRLASWCGWFSRVEGDGAVDSVGRVIPRRFGFQAPNVPVINQAKGVGTLWLVATRHRSSIGWVSLCLGHKSVERFCLFWQTNTKV
jgi:hypothetical protein